MAKYLVVSATATPVLNVRHAANRNARRLAKRVARLGDAVRVDLPNGRVKYYRAEDVTGYTVKRDAQRDARKSGGTFVAL